MAWPCCAGSSARLLVLLLLVAAAAAGGLVLTYDYWLKRPARSRQPAMVDLPRGSGVSGNRRRARPRPARSSIRWLFAARWRAPGPGPPLKAGEYALEPGMSPAAIIALLESGKVVLHPVAVPEGLTVREVYAILAAADVLTGELPPPPPEGTLLPETYLVPRGEPRAKVVERMRAGMRKALDELWAARAARPAAAHAPRRR